MWATARQLSAKALAPGNDFTKNLCEGGRTPHSGRFFSSRAVQKVTLSAVRQRVKRCAATHLQFAPMQLLICLLCVEECIACGPEKQCQTGLVRPSGGDGCCTRDTCEPSCAAEWILNQSRWDSFSCNAWWGSCGPLRYGRSLAIWHRSSTAYP